MRVQCNQLGSGSDERRSSQRSILFNGLYVALIASTQERELQMRTLEDQEIELVGGGLNPSKPEQSEETSNSSGTLSGREVVGAAGAVVGGALGGTPGSFFGSLAGAAIGGALDSCGCVSGGRDIRTRYPVQ